MTTTDSDVVRRLLLRRDYVTTVRKMKGDLDGVLVTYPYPRLVPESVYREYGLPRLVEAYTLKRDGPTGVYWSTSHDAFRDRKRGEKSLAGSSQGEEFLESPEYALRLLVICQVASWNAAIPVHPSLIVCYDAAGEERDELADLMREPDDPRETQRESFLFSLLVAAREDGFPAGYDDVAETHGVLQGFELLKQFYNTGKES